MLIPSADVAAGAGADCMGTTVAVERTTEASLGIGVLITDVVDG